MLGSMRSVLLSALVLAAANAMSSQPAVPQSGNALPVIVLDPAHGGPDTGARGAAGVVESDLVLDFARAIRVALQRQGLRVLLTREGNQGSSFDSRSALVNGLRGAIFISLHVSSTGPVGTARTYWCSLPADEPVEATSGIPGASRPAAPPPALQQPGLVEWSRAQQAYVDSSQRLAELVQIQLARRFQGSREVPEAAPVRPLRTIAAPAVAIEISSVAVPHAQQLLQMGPALAEAVARGVAGFSLLANSSAAAPGEEP